MQHIHAAETIIGDYCYIRTRVHLRDAETSKPSAGCSCWGQILCLWPEACKWWGLSFEPSLVLAVPCDSWIVAGVAVWSPLSYLQGQVLVLRGIQGSVRSCWKVPHAWQSQGSSVELLLGTAEPGSDSDSTSGLMGDKASAQEQLQLEKRGVRMWDKQPCGPQGSAGGGTELLQALEQRFPCSPRRSPAEAAGIHLQPLEEPTLSRGIPEKAVSPWETHLEQFVNSCSPWKGLSVAAVLLVIKFIFTMLQNVCDTELLIFSRNPPIPLHSPQCMTS